MSFMNKTAIRARAASIPEIRKAEAVPDMDPGAIAERIAEVITRYRETGRIPGAVVMVRGDNGTVTHAHGATTFDGAIPMAADTLFRQYCMTKPVLAVVLAQLVLAGRISPDDRLTRWFPEFGTTAVQGEDGSEGAGAGITIGMLADHTSGITMPILRMGKLQQQYLRLGLIDARMTIPQLAAMVGPRPSSNAEFCSRLATLPLVFRPGTSYEYGLSYDVLGAVVEKVADRPLPEIVRDLATGPLGMDDTCFVAAAADQARLAGEYYIRGEPVLGDGPASTVWTSPPPFWDGGAGMLSTTTDYARMVGLLSGRDDADAQIDPRIARMIRRDSLRADIRSSGPDEVDAGYGWGGYVQREDEPGGRPAGTYGWSGIAGTCFWCDPRNMVDVVVMAQVGPAQRMELRRDVTTAVYAA